jgi:hypothetical protein
MNKKYSFQYTDKKELSSILVSDADYQSEPSLTIVCKPHGLNATVVESDFESALKMVNSVFGDMESSLANKKEDTHNEVVGFAQTFDRARSEIESLCVNAGHLKDSQGVYVTAGFLRFIRDSFDIIRGGSWNDL